MSAVTVIDYGSGNLRSAAKALQRVADEAGGGAKVLVTADPDAVLAAERIVLPGVGAFAACYRGLAAIDGMIAALDEAVRARARPFFGICVGMQLIAEAGLEYGRHDGFAWLGGEVRRIDDGGGSVKVPHMGWNSLELPADPHPIFAGIDSGDHAYFVHSYQFCPADRGDVQATSRYAGEIIAAVGRDNIFGTQFHPEKSHRLGLRLLANFLAWAP